MLPTLAIHCKPSSGRILKPLAPSGSMAVSQITMGPWRAEYYPHTASGCNQGHTTSRQAHYCSPTCGALSSLLLRLVLPYPTPLPHAAQPLSQTAAWSQAGRVEKELTYPSLPSTPYPHVVGHTPTSPASHSPTPPLPLPPRSQSPCIPISPPFLPMFAPFPGMLSLSHWLALNHAITVLGCP